LVNLWLISKLANQPINLLTKKIANYLLGIGVSQNVIQLEYNFEGILSMEFTEQGIAMLL